MEPALARHHQRLREMNLANEAAPPLPPSSSSAMAADPADAQPSPTPPPPPASLAHRLRQQQLASYTVTFSPRAVITLYFAFAFLFIPLGVAIIAGTTKIETSGTQVYSDKPECAIKTDPDDGALGYCIIEINFTNPVPAPSYFYYSLTAFHQNARKYAKSRSDTMNQGILPKAQFDVETCEPYLYRNDSSEDGSFDPADFIYPCGLTARSFFNDSFSLCRDRDCDDQLDLRKDGIAWSTDVQHKFVPGEDPLFKQRVPAFPKDTTANSLFEDEDFVVWMRLSAFPNFDKLYRIIDEPLQANTSYFVRITPQFPVEQFGGTKAFYISTMSWLGGPNIFLGTAYLVVGLAALFIATTLLVKHIRNPRQPVHQDPEIFMRELAKLSGHHHGSSPASL